MDRERELVVNGIYQKRMSDIVLSIDFSIDFIWIKIIVKEVKVVRVIFF